MFQNESQTSLVMDVELRKKYLGDRVVKTLLEVTGAELTAKVAYLKGSRTNLKDNLGTHKSESETLEVMINYTAPDVMVGKPGSLGKTQP